MNCPNVTSAATRPGRLVSADERVKCVSSGYLEGGCSCRETTPAWVLKDAWARELEADIVSGDRFFVVAWMGATWLAYGERDGSVRGVYCPEHRAQRSAHEHEYRSSLSSPGCAPAMQEASHWPPVAA